MLHAAQHAAYAHYREYMRISRMVNEANNKVSPTCNTSYAPFDIWPNVIWSVHVWYIVVASKGGLLILGALIMNRLGLI